ncbi:N-acetyl-gamma-glutamyl-phosphate reductase, partial [Peptococcaceae bacterium SCADC1_2_3]
MIKVGIIGATGYTGAELVRLLRQHPQVELVALTTQQYVGLPFTEVYPHLSGKVNLVGEELNIPALVAKCEAVFVSLPHGHALPVAQEVIRQGKKMIDLGADIRLKDPAAYAKWYQVDLDQSLGRTITARLLAQAVYGLPELHRQEIKQAKTVANP